MLYIVIRKKGASPVKSNKRINIVNESVADFRPFRINSISFRRDVEKIGNNNNVENSRRATTGISGTRNVRQPKTMD